MDPVSFFVAGDINLKSFNSYIREAFDNGEIVDIGSREERKDGIGFTSFDAVLTRFKLKPLEICSNSKKPIRFPTRRSSDQLSVSSERKYEAASSSFNESLNQSLTREDLKDTDEKLLSDLDKFQVKQEDVELYQEYISNMERPFQMFKSDTPQETERLKQKERSYIVHLRDNLISDDDAWGMKRLQAHAGNSLMLLKGPYKGLPRSLGVNAALFHSQSDGIASLDLLGLQSTMLIL